ncbi:hypothetical protein PVNG_06293 [Plasmodium vivax North Korean]|uniref:Uncharacterized protein n=1 Tax=Plasmodium vivax North Korean TaxID=1035514 RepID=A0A0J9TMW2_PLAVI|nr:hypothetical protein PVNG_06293 [Plasmodium vivax North Korean]
MDGPNLDNLTSNKLYKQWSEVVKLRGSSYLSECYNYPSTPDDAYEGVNNLCKKLIRNLEDINNRENDEFYTCGLCKLLNYWLYDEVKKILGSDYRNNYTGVIKDLHAAWSKHKKYAFPKPGVFTRIEVEQKCKPDNNILNLIDIEHKKNIHEHCLNYYEISKNTINNNECQKYKYHIQRQSLSYDKFESLFAEDKDNYANYYKQCNSYNPKNIVTQSNCPKEIAIPETSERVAAPSGQSALEEGGEVREELDGGTVEGEVTEVVGTETRRVSEIEKETSDVERDEEVGKMKGDESKTSFPFASLQIDSTDQDLSIGISGADTDVSNVQSLNDSADNVKSTGTIISASSVGTIGFLFLVYKVNRRIINKYEYYRVFFQNE